MDNTNLQGFLKKYLKPYEILLWCSHTKNRVAAMKIMLGAEGNSIGTKIICNLGILFFTFGKKKEHEMICGLTDKRGFVLSKFKNSQKDKKTGQDKGNIFIKSLSYDELEDYSIARSESSSIFYFEKTKQGLKKRVFIIPNVDVEVVKNIISAKGQINSLTDPSPQTPTQTLH